MDAVEHDSRGYPCEDWLRRMFLEEHIPVSRLVEITGVPRATLYRLLDQYNIPRDPQLPTIDRETLERLYLTDGLSINEIAERYGMRYSGVYCCLKRYGIPNKHPTPRRTDKPTREWLLHRHTVEGVTWEAIMQEVHLRPSSFHRLLYDLGIERKRYVPVRSLATRDDLYQWHVVDGLTAGKIAGRLGCNPSAVQRLIKRYELDPGRPLVNTPVPPPISKELLHDLYWKQGQSAQRIAEPHGVTVATVYRWFRFYGIARRTGKRRTGPKATPKARKSRADIRYPHEFNAGERYRIHERDGWRCQMPGCGCAEKWRLEAHHIVPIANGGTHALTNGITLCRPCHQRIQGREAQHAQLFQEIVNTLSCVQRSYIGETPEKDNPDGSSVA
jgi:transposase